MRTIILKLAGPLQSWGCESHFETRQTNRYPTKSGIVGLLAACLGYRRDNEAEIKKLGKLEFAVRIDQEGKVLRDFHTAKSYDDKGKLKRTYVTNRYYLQDAMFLVAIGSEDEEWLEKIYQALKYPYFQPFMGRRSLPLNVNVIFQCSEKNVLDSLREIPWQANEWYRRGHSSDVELYYDVELNPKKFYKYQRDMAESFSVKERKYTLRGEAKEIWHMHDETIREHDAFGELEV